MLYLFESLDFVELKHLEYYNEEFILQNIKHAYERTPTPPNPRHRKDQLFQSPAGQDHLDNQLLQDRQLDDLKEQEGEQKADRGG